MVVSDRAADYANLPRAKMRPVRIAFDVDGTLRCNCTDTCQDPNTRIVELFKILATFKNTDLHVWSGGGAAYAWRFAQLYDLPVNQSRCYSKFSAPPMDLCVDDIQETDLASINLIVREK
ncbi:hypothetical protein GCM10009570_25160 [Dietzia natronolimnaea]